MRSATVFSIFSCALAVILTAPTLTVSSTINNLSVYAPQNSRAIRKGVFLIESMDQASTLEIATRDFLSDIIRLELRMEVAELLSMIDRNLISLRTHHLDALKRVNEIKVLLNPTTSQEIETLISNALLHGVDIIIAPILKDFGLVMPAISNKTSSSKVSQEVADLINAILQITLEQFLRKILTVLEQSDNLLINVMTDINRISYSISNSQLAYELRDVSTSYLSLGRAVIRPNLESLSRVLFPMQISVKSKGMVADIMSGVLKFDVPEAANLFTAVWDKELKEILHNSLGHLEKMPFSEEVKEEIRSVVVKSVEEVSTTIFPLIHVLVHFANETSREFDINRDLPKDIVDSLLGVSLSDFLFYIDFCVNRTRQIGDTAQAEVIQIASASTHSGSAIPIALWASVTVEKMKAAIMPFLTLIDPILPPLNFERKWVSLETLYSPLNQDDQHTFCDFSLKTGRNKEYIVKLVSTIFKFEITQATEILISKLTEMEDILNEHFNSLSVLLQKSDVESGVMQNLDMIIRKGMNDTQVVIQPGLDVFLLFAPNNSRHDRDILADMIRTLSSITHDSFVQYVRSTITQVELVVEKYMSEIRLATSDLDFELSEKIEEIVLSAVQRGSQIITPFLESIKPIFSQ